MSPDEKDHGKPWMRGPPGLVTTGKTQSDQACHTSLPVIQFLLSSHYLLHHPRQLLLPPSTPSGHPESVCPVPSAAHLPSSSLPLPSLELLASSNRLPLPGSNASQRRALSPLGRKGGGRVVNSVACAAEVGTLRTSGHTHTRRRPITFHLGKLRPREKEIHPRCKASWD